MKQQELLERMADRGGEIWLTVYEDEPSLDSFDAVARAAGLRPLGRGWDEVDRSRATEILSHVLHQDLAYSTELLPLDEANALAKAFIDHFSTDNTRYAANTAGAPSGSTWSWTPATDATFDMGVLIVNDSSGAVYWVADED